MLQNTSQIKVDYKIGGTSNYTTLEEVLNRKVVDRLPFNSTQVLTYSNTSVAKIDDSILAGNLAVGVSSTTISGGIIAALGTQNISTAETTLITNSQGIILNKVDVRDASTNDPIFDTDGRRLYGLLQTIPAVADGTAIEPATTENVKLTLIKINTSEVPVAVLYTGTVEFQINKLYSELTLPNIRMNGGLVDMDVISTPGQVMRKLLITGSFAANETINISTGAGSVAGTATASGATITLPTTETVFNNNANIRVYRNGALQDKGTGNDIVWLSTTTFRTTQEIDIGETLLIEVPSSY